MTELSEAEPAPAQWAQDLGAVSHLPGPAVVVAIVPDEDASIEPTVLLARCDEDRIPYEIMRWFMEMAAEEVERCRSRLSDLPPAVAAGSHHKAGHTRRDYEPGQT